jgi:hypothetical protein
MRRREYGRKPVESDADLLKRQEVMFKLDQIRNRPPDEVSEDQIRRFEAALAEYRSKSERVRAFEESVEAAKRRLREERDHGMTRAGDVRMAHGDAWEGPETDVPQAETAEDDIPPAEVS